MALHLRIIWIISMRGIPTFCQEAYEKNDTESKKCQNSTKCSNSTKHSNCTNIIVIHICNLLIFTWCTKCSYSTKHSKSTNSIVIYIYNFLIFTWWWIKNYKKCLFYYTCTRCLYVVALFWIIEKRKVISIARSAEKACKKNDNESQ